MLSIFFSVLQYIQNIYRILARGFWAIKMCCIPAPHTTEAQPLPSGGKAVANVWPLQRCRMTRRGHWGTVGGEASDIPPFFARKAGDCSIKIPTQFYVFYIITCIYVMWTFDVSTTGNDATRGLSSQMCLLCLFSLKLMAAHFSNARHIHPEIPQCICLAILCLLRGHLPRPLQQLDDPMFRCISSPPLFVRACVFVLYMWGGRVWFLFAKWL